GPQLGQRHGARHPSILVLVVSAPVCTEVVHALERAHECVVVLRFQRGAELPGGLALGLTAEILRGALDTLGRTQDRHESLARHHAPHLIWTEFPGSSLVKFPYAPNR